MYTVLGVLYGRRRRAVPRGEWKYTARILCPHVKNGPLQLLSETLFKARQKHIGPFAEPALWLHTAGCSNRASKVGANWTGFWLFKTTALDKRKAELFI
jgi:hypothetical protein